MGDIPKDPVILLSFINTALRDRFPTLERLCKAYGISVKEIVEKLGSIDYNYDEQLNRFV